MCYVSAYYMIKTAKFPFNTLLPPFSLQKIFWFRSFFWWIGQFWCKPFISIPRSVNFWQNPHFSSNVFGLKTFQPSLLSRLRSQTLIGINCGTNVYAQQPISWNPLNGHQMEKPWSSSGVTALDHGVSSQWARVLWAMQAGLCLLLEHGNSFLSKWTPSLAECAEIHTNIRILDIHVKNKVWKDLNSVFSLPHSTGSRSPFASGCSIK